jgi:biopolymer transport protein ExbB
MYFLQDYIYRIYGYLSSGGVVMIPLLMVSFVMWLLIIHRALFLRRLYLKTMPRQAAGQMLRENRLPGPEYRGVNAALVRAFLARRCGRPELDAHILDETVLAVVVSLDRHQSAINILAGVAPLLGLLGTVTGMIVTFDVITQFGTGNVRALAGGISEALITTETGLLVSIPGLYMSGFLAQRATTLKQRTASAGIYLKRFLTEAA